MPTPQGFAPMSPEEAGRPRAAAVRIRPPVRSRVHAGATTFGIWGRLALTGLVVLGGPWLPGREYLALTLFLYLPVYLLIAVPLLLHIWRSEPIAGPIEPVHVRLPEPGTLAALRLAAVGVGVALLAVGAWLRPWVPLVYLPAIPFLVAALHPVAWRGVERGIGRLEERPLAALVLLNGLNALDSAATVPAIRAEHAREVNPLVTAFGHGPKLALVLAVGLVLYHRHPGALIWPLAAFVALAAYHLTGYLGTLGL